MSVVRSNVAGLLVPLAVVVVGHHVDPVQVLGDGGHVVPNVHDGLAGAHGGGQQQPARLEGVGELLDPGSEGGLVLVSLLLTLSLTTPGISKGQQPGGMSYLPAAGILPVKVQPIEVVLLDELDGVLDEPGPGRRVVDQSAVLVPLAVIPASQRQGHLDAVLLELRHLPVHILPRVAWIQYIQSDQVPHVKLSPSDMSAYGSWDFIRRVEPSSTANP